MAGCSVAINDLCLVACPKQFTSTVKAEVLYQSTDIMSSRPVGWIECPSCAVRQSAGWVDEVGTVEHVCIDWLGTGSPDFVVFCLLSLDMRETSNGFAGSRITVRIEPIVVQLKVRDELARRTGRGGRTVIAG